MKSTAHLNGHPIHPVLIPFPFAFLSGGTAFEIAASMTGRQHLSQTAMHMMRLGLGSAVIAALPGIVDYFGSIPRETEAKRFATRHALVNVSALACFGVAESMRAGQQLPRAALMLSLVGTGLLSVGGWLGGELIYHHGVGVDNGQPARRLSAGSLPQVQRGEAEAARD